MNEKEKVFSDIELHLKQVSFSIKRIDMDRPWGGFFVIEEKDSEKFIDHFFPGIIKSDLSLGKLSPKILLVSPQKKLSWQYHFRRSEIWKVVQGNVAVAKSNTDIEMGAVFLKKGDFITLRQGERHRLIGLNEWGIVAEIWIHTDDNNPSNEEDIVRLQDDFGR